MYGQWHQTRSLNADTVAKTRVRLEVREKASAVCYGEPGEDIKEYTASSSSSPDESNEPLPRNKLILSQHSSTRSGQHYCSGLVYELFDGQSEVFLDAMGGEGFL